jgi:hypothetical protein
MEEETLPLLTGGYLIISILSLIYLLILWKKYKPFRIGLTWFICYLIIFSIAVFFGLTTLGYDISGPMASENFSLGMGITGVIWFVSMIFFLKGVLSFIHINK